MFSFSGETVLDPFLGSGTTALAARNLGRNSVGYEINLDFISTINDKLNVSQSDLAATEYVFQEDIVKTDLNKEIEKNCHIFSKTLINSTKRLTLKNFNSVQKLIKTAVTEKSTILLKK